MIINYNELSKKLNNTKIPQSFNLSKSKDGNPCLRACSGNENEKGSVNIYISSRYNPENEAKQFADKNYSDSENIFIYGLGLGYHIKALYKLLRENQKLYILECSMPLVKIAFENTDIKNILNEKNIMFLATDNQKDSIMFAKKFISKDCSCIIHEPSLKIMPENISIKELFESYLIRSKTLNKFSDLMEENNKYNSSLNLKNGLEFIKSIVYNKPLIIVSAGPSLSLSIEKLRIVSKKAYILAVLRSANVLKNAGIRPDFYIVTDAKISSYQQLKYADTSVPLILLSTANKNVTLYSGEKYIIYEKYTAAELQKNSYAVETGGSVATTALSLSVLSGANPNILLGQDLCYWSDLRHAGEKSSYSEVKTNKYVKGINGETYYTTLNLYEYLRWFGRFAERNKDKNILNATEKGAAIDNIPNIDLVDTLINYPNIK